MDDRALMLITLFVPPLVLLVVTKFGMWRGDRRFRREHPDKIARVPGCVNLGCLWGPALILFVMLLHGAAQIGW